jgi:hypothetical protein
VEIARWDLKRSVLDVLEYRPPRDSYLHSKLTFTGVTGLEGKISPDSIANIRSVDPRSLPTTDLTSVPGPLRWFVNTYGAHTPAALIHDRLIGIENGPSDLTDVLADRYSGSCSRRSG